MLEWLLDPSAWIALATLTLLEIVLGIDNIIFIAIIVSKLPLHQRDKARVLGLGLAMFTRIALLASLFWIMKLTQPLFEILGNQISGRDIILILGGLFLIYKSTHEIHSQINSPALEKKDIDQKTSGFFSTLIQISILDIIFSLDSVVTAVGMADHLPVMVIAIVLAVLIMMVASKSISEFVERNPTIKTLALAFLMMVGIALVADGLDFHIPKGYIYFAMVFSLGVECINIYANKKAKK
ncbi:hypothetical protein BKH41_03590 [Helicobacter sp. 12S02232-10]|uniref:TerC family protein n=1 Tax=Helicobacter sp. 12S02232-10 TaxID=1476197 RepID=UPI000BCD3F34|nr:TerC family protein [Helicobacter sp. 12S02232-10]PAF49177.1 hypothetical protein BKH41_03590 [Helicobacter sp. 12S02232-10]